MMIKKNNEFDIEQLKRNLALTPLERLDQLEQLNAFLQAAMPDSSKAKWEKLKQKGF